MELMLIFIRKKKIFLGGFAFAEATGLFAYQLALFLLLILYYTKIDAMVKLQLYLPFLAFFYNNSHRFFFLRRFIIN